ncbi:MAG TPA: aminotransferase class IV, partial [Clostridia bacterium]|nr:aminotransferase class IV [Clostridia bacterium]
GVGVRGYSPKGANSPVLVMTLHPAPPIDSEQTPRWHLKTASVRLPSNEPLAQFKNCNKLSQILARAEAEAANADEALLVNTDGYVVEGAASNLFWIERGVVCSPPLASGILAGVTRAVVVEVCQTLQLPVREVNATLDQLLRSDAVFLSLSSWGIVPAISLNGKPLNQSPLTDRIRQTYVERLMSET